MSLRLFNSRYNKNYTVCQTLSNFLILKGQYIVASVSVLQANSLNRGRLKCDFQVVLKTLQNEVETDLGVAGSFHMCV